MFGFSTVKDHLKKKVEEILDKGTINEVDGSFECFNFSGNTIIVKYKNENIRVQMTNERLSKLLNAKVLQNSSIS